MKNKVVLIGLFVCAYFVFVIAQLPANIAVGWLTMPSTVKLGKVEGSIWQAEISAVQYQGLVVNNIHANLSPWSLLLLSPSINADFGGGLIAGPKGNVSADISTSNQALENSKIEMAANDIVPYLQLPIDLEAFGQVTLDVKQLVASEGKCQQADGVVSWQRAAVTALDQNIDLGNFTGQLSCQGEKFALIIKDNNRLGLSYTALFEMKRGLTGQGYILPGANFPKELEQVLPFLGKADSQGRYSLKL